MSNANRNMLGTATHYTERRGHDAPAAFCSGAPARHSTTDRTSVTCKRCLASLAKRDRAFQRKARKGLNSSVVTERQWLSMFAGWRDAHDAARAIAREEGRAGAHLMVSGQAWADVGRASDPVLRLHGRDFS